MRVVEDETGRRYVLLKRSREASLVRDVETGERRHVPTATLAEVDGSDPLEAAGRSLSPAVRERLPAGLGHRGLGLLVVLAAGARSARSLLDATDLCERDLLGVVGELRAAGLVREADVDGEPGYAATAAAREALGAGQSARRPDSAVPD